MPDAITIISTVHSYENGDLDYSDASLILIAIGLDKEEVQKLLAPKDKKEDKENDG